MDKLTKANIVATALFGDGAAACVVRASETGLAEVEFAGQHTRPDTLGWSVDPEGLGVIFDRAIPPFAETHVLKGVTSILARSDLTPADVDRFACHPGGSKVITALESALKLSQGTLDQEREVLSDYGNMSSPTALFVLEKLLAQGLPWRTVLTAMGPGFTLSCLSLTAAA
ncbi:putative naringenin-chalcone synthase [Rhizobium leguminosarum]|nr:putative naringenin-chalcone synthase [Rhizobium leguminosarum]